MKKMLLIAGSLLALTGMSACADYGYSYGYGNARGYGPGRQSYDIYYDDYYGPVREGYWGDDGWFYYRDNQRRWQRDDGRHFRKDSYNGYHSYRMNRGHR